MAILDSCEYFRFHCLRANREHVVAAVRAGLEASGIVHLYDASEGPVDVRRVCRSRASAQDQRVQRVLFFAPRAASGWTIQFTNMVDGWTTLTHALSRDLGCLAYEFALCHSSVEWPLHRFARVEAGRDTRIVQVLKDDPEWVFWQRGDPLPEEVPTEYTARLRRKRLTREAVIRLATRLGFRIQDDVFWTSDETGTYFETREARP